MRDSQGHPTGNGNAGPGCVAPIDDLLEQAVAAINRGDRAAGTALAEQVLAVDNANADAEDLLADPADPGEIRRLTILFADLVDSTVLSSRVEPETYRMLVGSYCEHVYSSVHQYEGHVGSNQGDGLLAVFGHPCAHEDDARRAVLAGLEITRGVARLNDQAQRRFGVGISVRVGVHRGLVYLDTTYNNVYGLAANLAARVAGLAPPGSLVISGAVEPLVRTRFELRVRPSVAVKGVDGLIAHHQVIGERVEPVKGACGPLVGRDCELARLHESWARVCAGTLTTAGIVFRGEPGIGKTRLTAAAAELVENSGAVTLELVGSSLHTDAGLHPVRSLLEQRCGIGRSTDPDERLRLLRAEVVARSLDPETTVPLLAPVLGIGTEAGYEPVAAESRTLYGLIAAAVQNYLLACLGDGPGLIVAEDVHWFDPSTLEVLGSLLRAGKGRLLVVVTGRPGEWLPTDWPTEIFELQPLSDEQTDSLITALNPGVSAQDRASIADRCDGVPFYIEQVVAGLAETGVPETLYEPLFARLRARPEVMPVLQAAAVNGRHVDRGLLCSVVDMGERAVDGVIEELENALVLEPWGSDGWRFRHELLREVAAEVAPPSVRKGLHAKVADALVGVGGERDWRVVAAHYEQAERFNEAATAYQHASTSARRRGALTEARRYLTQSLGQLDRATPSRDRDRREMALRLERGFLVMTADGQHNRESAADFERCLQLGGTDLRDDELFATLNALTGYYAARADLHRLAQVLQPLRAGLEGRPWFRPAIEVESGVLAWLRGEFDSARIHFEHATRDVVPTDKHEIEAVWFVPSDAIATAHLHLAWTRLVLGDRAGAQADLAQAARCAGELDFPQGPYMRDYTAFMECWIHIETGQLDRAADVADDMVGQAAQRPEFDTWRLPSAALHATVSGLAALAHRDPDALSANIATLTSLLADWRATGVHAYTTFFDGVLGRLLIAASRSDEARRRLDGGLQLAADTGMCFYDAELLRLRGHTRNDPAAGRADIAAARNLARRQGATLFELRAALDDFDLRGDETRLALIDVAERMPSECTWPELERVRVSLASTCPQS